MDKFYIGIILGIFGGALLVNKPQKVEKMIDDGAKTIKQKVKMLAKKAKQ